MKSEYLSQAAILVSHFNTEDPEGKYKMYLKASNLTEVKHIFRNKVNNVVPTEDKY